MSMQLPEAPVPNEAGSFGPHQDNPLEDNTHQTVTELRGVRPWERAAQVGAMGLVAAEVSPANEVVRGVISTGVQSMADNDPIVGTIAFDAATFAVEAPASVAAAYLLNTPVADETIRKVREKAQKIPHFGAYFKDGEDMRRTGVVADTAIGLLGGSAVAVLAKKIQDPESTAAGNARFGVVNSGVVSVAVTPVAAAFSKVVEVVGPENLTIGGAAAVAVGGLAKVVYDTGKHHKSKKQSAAEVDLMPKGELQPARYDLSPEEVEQSQKEIVAAARAKFGRKVSAVWIAPDSPYMNTMRTIEAGIFPEMPDVMRDYESQSAFLAIVDNRRSAGQGRIIRGTRITSPQFDEAQSGVDSAYKTAMVDGLVKSGQVTLDEVIDYANKTGLDLEHSISVETNFRIGERAKRRFGITPISYLAYLSIGKYRLSQPSEPDKNPALVAHVNSATEKSFAQLGIQSKAFADRTDLKTPGMDGTFDEKYRPAVYTYDKKTRQVFSRLGRFALPTMQIEHS